MVRVSRQTRQKEILADEIKKRHSFFSAEDIYRAAQKKDKTIGIATVYRYLKFLKNHNRLHSYVCDRKTIYSVEDKNHCHFTCEQCGRLEHIHIQSLDFLKRHIGGEICHFQIDVTGICEKCKK